MAIDLTAPPTKSSQIARKIRNDIRTGVLEPGARLKSIRALAAEAGVSPQVVCSAFDVLAREGLVLKQVGRAGTFVTESAREALDRDLPHGLALGLLAPANLEDPNFRTYGISQSISVLDDICETNQLSMAFFNLEGHETIPDRTLAQIRDAKLDGLIVNLGWIIACPEMALARLACLGLPAVFINAHFPGVDSTDFDNEQLGRDGAEFLLAKGHRDVRFLGYPPARCSWVSERIRGFLQVLRERGISPDNRHVVLTDIPPLNELPDPEPIRAWLTGHEIDFTAVFCANDTLAGRVIDILGSLGVRVPEDVSVLGIDDWAPCREYNLTTFRLSGGDMAREAYHLLMERIRTPERPPEHRTVRCPLVERRTVRAMSRKTSRDQTT